tara:strand:+ start:988 stop:1311 length:324 start_codon:yes stop_codon:yes gene_type:complete
MKALLTILALLVNTVALCQIKAVHFNAEWNEQNNVEWFNKLSDCNKKSLTIDGNDLQQKHQIAIVPTIIIFNDNEEVKRFQADISFKMAATKNDIQEFIDNLIMSEF